MDLATLAKLLPLAVVAWILIEVAKWIWVDTKPRRDWGGIENFPDADEQPNRVQRFRNEGQL